jgi:hypothetical protein
MPNHVTHRVIVTGPADQIAAFKTRAIRLIDDRTEPCLDFNAFIPMPADIANTESGSSTDFWMMALGNDEPGMPLRDFSHVLTYPWVQAAGIKTREEFAAYLQRSENWQQAKANAERQLTNKDKYGHYNWHDWSRAKWGTKWGAYSFAIASDEPVRLEFKFDTAWSTPEPVFDAIAEAFPALRFEIACYDEGANFAGYGFLNGRHGDEPFATCNANNRLYELTYGQPPEIEDDEDGDEQATAP